MLADSPKQSIWKHIVNVERQEDGPLVPQEWLTAPQAGRMPVAFVHPSVLVAKPRLYSHGAGAVEGLEPVLPEALASQGPAEGAIIPAGAGAAGHDRQAEHPRGQCMRRGVSPGRARSGGHVVGKAGV